MKSHTINTVASHTSFSGDKQAYSLNIYHLIIKFQLQLCCCLTFSIITTSRLGRLDGILAATYRPAAKVIDMFMFGRLSVCVSFGGCKSVGLGECVTLCPCAAVQTCGDGARWHKVRELSVEGVTCCCVLFRSNGRGLQGSVKGHRGVPMNVCVMVCMCVFCALVKQ